MSSEDYGLEALERIGIEDAAVIRRAVRALEGARAWQGEAIANARVNEAGEWDLSVEMAEGEVVRAERRLAGLVARAAGRNEMLLDRPVVVRVDGTLLALASDREHPGESLLLIMDSSLAVA